jgi:hypothetical protein
MSVHGLSELRRVIEQGHTLVQDKLEQWEWYARFIEMNPDLHDRWEQHKTYEILKNEQLPQR